MRPPFLFFEETPLLNIGLSLQNSPPLKFISASSVHFLLPSLTGFVHASPSPGVSSLDIVASPKLGSTVAFSLKAFSGHHNLQRSKRDPVLSDDIGFRWNLQLACTQQNLLSS